MPDRTKITLSPQEQVIVEDTSWVLTKQEIIKKVYELFNGQVAMLGQLLQSDKARLPSVVFNVIPKISRGENYRGLPYVILDYPSVFGGENIFAVRTMFWWGNFFSITLHLSGVYKEMYQAHISELLGQSTEQDIFLCVNTKEWEHHFDPDNYVPVHSLSVEDFAAYIKSRTFLKVAVKINLNEWNRLQTILPTSYERLIKLLNTQLPIR